MTIESKQEVLDFLSVNIPDLQTRNHILCMANDLVVDDTLREDLAALQSKRMGQVYGAFKRHNLEFRHRKPPLDQVLSWLLLSSGLPYIDQLEERLGEINSLLMDLGMIDLDESVDVKATTILEMRVLSKIDPASRPARLRKKRVSRKIDGG